MVISPPTAIRLYRMTNTSRFNVYQYKEQLAPAPTAVSMRQTYAMSVNTIEMVNTATHVQLTQNRKMSEGSKELTTRL